MNITSEELARIADDAIRNSSREELIALLDELKGQELADLDLEFHDVHEGSILVSKRFNVEAIARDCLQLGPQSFAPLVQAVTAYEDLALAA